MNRVGSGSYGINVVFGMAFVRDFNELEVYRMSTELAKVIFDLTRTFPREEAFALTDQVRRSSRSIGAQIAESWGKRYYQRHFISKLSDAISEVFETGHWIRVAASCDYISELQAAELINQCGSINAMLNSMIVKSHLFIIKTPAK